MLARVCHHVKTSILDSIRHSIPQGILKTRSGVSRGKINFIIGIYRFIWCGTISYPRRNSTLWVSFIIQLAILNTLVDAPVVTSDFLS